MVESIDTCGKKRNLIYDDFVIEFYVSLLGPRELRKFMSVVREESFICAIGVYVRLVKTFMNDLGVCCCRLIDVEGSDWYERKCDMESTDEAKAESGTKER